MINTVDPEIKCQKNNNISCDKLSKEARVMYLKKNEAYKLLKSMQDPEQSALATLTCTASKTVVTCFPGCAVSVQRFHKSSTFNDIK